MKSFKVFLNKLFSNTNEKIEIFGNAVTKSNDEGIIIRGDAFHIVLRDNVLVDDKKAAN